MTLNGDPMIPDCPNCKEYLHCGKIEAFEEDTFPEECLDFDFLEDEGDV